MADRQQGQDHPQKLDEYFARADDRFVALLRATTDPRKLAELAERWKSDPRPWARQQMLRYLEEPFDRPGHQPLVRRLFKHAEERRDHELLARFFTGFDRLVRRQRKKVWQYDWSTGESWSTEELVSPRNTLPTDWQPRQRIARNPFSGEVIALDLPQGDLQQGMLYSYHTRYYLRRRVWRYYRRLGHQQPEQFPAAIAQALVLYTDDDLQQGENLLDSWSLIHACFGEHDALEFTTSRARLKPGRTLAELKPAPVYPATWEAPTALPILMTIVRRSRTRMPRQWAMTLLREAHSAGLRQLPATDVLPLLNHDDSEVQEFGAEILQSLDDLSRLSLDAWLQLIETTGPTALDLICQLMQQHVRSGDLTRSQCVAMACSPPAPVARLGLDFLRQMPHNSPEERESLVELADTRCTALAAELTEWALPHFGTPETYNRDCVLRFLDSLNSETRTAAWQWLLECDAASGDSLLWVRLLETPFDDIRLKMIAELERRADLFHEGPAGASNTGRSRSAALVPLWSAVLLGVHRGGRQKALAVKQVARAVLDSPADDELLLPVLITAVRSIRAPEFREGLTAIVQLTHARPELAARFTELLPELTLTPADSA